MPHFDQLKTGQFKTVTKHMGYKAAWFSPDTAQTRQASLGVTFKYPTLREKQFIEWDEFVYNPPNRIVEYMEPDFPGLYDLVNNSGGSTGETLIINKGDGQPLEVYTVGKVARMFDGSVFYALVYPNIEQ